MWLQQLAFLSGTPKLAEEALCHVTCQASRVGVVLDKRQVVGPQERLAQPMAAGDLLANDSQLAALLHRTEIVAHTAHQHVLAAKGLKEVGGTPATDSAPCSAATHASHLHNGLPALDERARVIAEGTLANFAQAGILG